MDVVETSTIQPRFMEVEEQSRMDRLCNFKLLKTNFDAIFDGLETDGRNIADEFVDWESAGPLCTASMNSEMLCVVKQNFALMQTTFICLALHTPEEIPRKFGLPEQLIWWKLI